MKLSKPIVIAACLAALASTPIARAQSTARARPDVTAQKNASVSGVPMPQVHVGGDDIATAFEVLSLPFTDSGNTCTFANDYDEVCPFTGSTSPDLVYRFAPDVDLDLTVSLCGSGYDTKLYVYENAVGNLVGCNDDACGSDGFKSELRAVPLTAGSTYYIVVDGYMGDCGEYEIAVAETVPCEIACPPGWIAENEPICGTNYVDITNGGCNSEPPVFMQAPCGGLDGSSVVCGEYGGFEYNGFDYRDTDWYQALPWNGTEQVVVCVQGEIGTILGVFDGGDGCPAGSFVQSVVTDPCEPACLLLDVSSEAHRSAPWWIFVAPRDFGSNAGECGSRYVLQIDGVCPPGVVPVEASTWAAIKGRYRK